MDKRSLVKAALDWKRPPYVPWNLNFTLPAREKLQAHYGKCNLEEVIQNHIICVDNQSSFFHDIGNDSVQDIFGVVWDRSVDKDIGVVKSQVLPQPTLINGFRG